MNKQTEKEIFDRIKKSFEKSNISYKEALYVSGSAQDFYFISPTGGTATIEIKSWEPTTNNLHTAEMLAKSYLNVTDTDYAFVVLPEVKTSNFEKGVLSVEDVEKIIQSPSILKKRKKDSSRPRIIEKKFTKNIFVAMPFSDKYYDTFAVAVEPACTKHEYSCVRIDYEEFSGDIVCEIKSRIEKSQGVIVDISESRPNVLFELGFAFGLGRKIIQICSTSKEKIPFDIRNDKTIFYKIGQTKILNNKLNKSIQKIFSNK